MTDTASSPSSRSRAPRQQLAPMTACFDLLPLIASFCSGVSEDVCALRRACRGCSVADAFHALFKPWFARRGTSELHRLCQVHLLVYAIDFEDMEVLRWLAAEHRITAQASHHGNHASKLELPTASTYRCPDLVSVYYWTNGSTTIYTHRRIVRKAAIRNHVDILRMSLDLGCGMNFIWEEA
ncbi:hypothetical protein SPRG_06917 [Saprolegnia parasitica CBS 223.65]|uniref:Uncharacterized protein n=1 Tax=Saprolegnia parasitica (strain CBS 223.65) TaxID=695850 RepID=A0A067CM93_SAPPC|nr:hypothetical protein SPRG_06917 [Saprolegnia parasitica CBS 223.65]KDO27646.1 hypothetical protein SPRG_06917 [Saprolegnia parasitica CBS 223.65]|eukprot:XP_012201768.1 hypothetical protein SPRG_06917 [Saprolegnia parasitica CBS 223.65]